jgi:hypothetical protein
MALVEFECCGLCRVGRSATAVHVFDPMQRNELRADWAYVCRGCAPAVDAIVAAMLADNPRLRVHVESLRLRSLVAS